MQPSPETPRGMLILYRYPQQSLHIGDDVIVTVLSVDGNQVRLGFHAPPHVGIYREEIYRRLQAERNATANTPSPHPQIIVRCARSQPGE